MDSQKKQTEGINKIKVSSIENNDKELITCHKCNSTLLKSNLKKHLRKAHKAKWIKNKCINCNKTFMVNTSWEHPSKLCGGCNKKRKDLYDELNPKYSQTSYAKIYGWSY